MAAPPVKENDEVIPQNAKGIHPANGIQDANHGAEGTQEHGDPRGKGSPKVSVTRRVTEERDAEGIPIPECAPQPKGAPSLIGNAKHSNQLSCCLEETTKSLLRQNLM